MTQIPRNRTRASRALTTSTTVLVLTALLAGCSLFAMSKEEAGAHYLAVVCPSNLGNDTLTAAYDTNDLGSIKAAAQALADTERESAKKLLDESTNWPSGVAREDLETLANSYLTDLSLLSSVVQAESLEQTQVIWPNEPDVGEASQRVRLALDLSSDTSVGCE